MPYCPKCDMEFVEGITVCSDCGSPLMESEEVAKAAKKKEEEEAKALLIEQYRTQMETMQAACDQMENSTDEDSENDNTLFKQPVRSGVYVNKKQKYEDLKSSASAFTIVGTILLAASLLCWIGIINIPMAGITKLIFQSALTIMGVFSILVAINSTKSAKKLAPQIDEEQNTTKNLIQWFLDSYDGAAIDQAVEGAEDLSPEELSLKRFQIIQDFLVTHHDLPDPAYVDALSEEIYGNLFD